MVKKLLARTPPTPLAKLNRHGRTRPSFFIRLPLAFSHASNEATASNKATASNRATASKKFKNDNFLFFFPRTALSNRLKTKSINSRYNIGSPIILFWIVAILATLTGCHRHTSPQDVAVVFYPCTPPIGQNKIPESECASLALAENPNDPASAIIDVHFLRIKAVNAKPQTDPLVLIQGGPGGSSITMAYSLYRYFSSVRQNRDLLFVDLRGTGRSNPLNCPGLESINSQLSDTEALQAYQTIMNHCAAKYRNNAAFYTTAFSVNDLETIRASLGYQQLNLWGASYGSRVALKYAVEYPALTRSLILDGLAPRSISLPRFIARDATSAFVKLNRYCQSDALCQNHYGDLSVNATKITQHLQAAEAAHTPVRVTLPDPLNQQPKEWIFTPRRFAQLLISVLYSRELTSLAPRALKEAADGNYRLLATLNALADAGNQQLSIAEGLYFSVVCNEDLAQPTDTENTDVFFMGVNLIDDKIAVCAAWPKAQGQAPTKQINHTPTLLLSGALDPVTPKIWADLVALTQLNNQSIEVPGGNHVVSILGCAPNLIAQFINSPNTKLPLECAQAIAPLPFYLGADQASETKHTKDSHD